MMADNYIDRNWDLDSMRKGFVPLTGKRHVKLRSEYYNPNKNKEKHGPELLINSRRIEVRGDKLARRIREGRYKEAIEIYLNTGDLTNAVLECGYLRQDYNVSPEMAEKIFSYALIQANIKRKRIEDKLESDAEEY